MIKKKALDVTKGMNINYNFQSA